MQGSNPPSREDTTHTTYRLPRARPDSLCMPLTKQPLTICICPGSQVHRRDRCAQIGLTGGVNTGVKMQGRFGRHLECIYIFKIVHHKTYFLKSWDNQNLPRAPPSCRHRNSFGRRTTRNARTQREQSVFQTSNACSDISAAAENTQGLARRGPVGRELKISGSASC